jgi:hypothetical protein
VVNINKMKQCYRKVPPSPPAPTDIPTSASEKDGGQEVTDEERVTSPIPYNQLANGNSSAPAPPVEIDEEREDLTRTQLGNQEDDGRLESQPMNSPIYCKSPELGIGCETGRQKHKRARTSLCRKRRTSKMIMRRQKQNPSQVQQTR